MNRGKLARAVTITAMALATFSVVLPAAAEADSSVSVSTSPALQPGFDPVITDYVTTCAAGSVSVSITDTDGTPVSVAGQAAQTTSFTTPVTLASSQAFTIVIGTTTYNVRCLPSDFPPYTSTVYPSNGTPQAAYYLITPGNGYEAMFNNYGVPVWWYKVAPGALGSAEPIDFNVLADGDLSWATEQVPAGLGQPGNVTFGTYTLTGTQLLSLHTAVTPTDFHEGLQLPNGNFVMTTYILNQLANLTSVGLTNPYPVLDAGFQELTPAGKVVFAWDSNGRIQPSESAAWLSQTSAWPGVTGKVWDEFHINSVAQDGSNWLVSMRDTNAVWLINGKTGAIIWKLGGTHTSKSLTIEGDPDAATDFSGQHDARLLPNGDITLYDDATQASRPPRALEFKVYPVLRIAKLVQTISDSTGVVATPSTCCGSARVLPGGDWVVDWGNNSIVDEVRPTSATTSVPVLRIAMTPPYFTYRGLPVNPGVFTDAQLQAAMNTMNPPPAAAYVH